MNKQHDKSRKKDRRSYAARRQYLITAVLKKRKKVRLKAIVYKGGRCELCGYDRCTDALEFHHKDQSQKHFGISNKGYCRSWERVKEELNKCILICANCHREIHAQNAAFRRKAD